MGNGPVDVELFEVAAAEPLLLEELDEGVGVMVKTMAEVKVDCWRLVPRATPVVKDVERMTELLPDALALPDAPDVAAVSVLEPELVFALVLALVFPPLVDCRKAMSMKLLRAMAAHVPGQQPAEATQGKREALRAS